MSAARTDAPPKSPECMLAQRPAYEGLHSHCRQTEDIPLPGATGILLQPRCGCACHAYNAPHV